MDRLCCRRLFCCTEMEMRWLAALWSAGNTNDWAENSLTICARNPAFRHIWSWWCYRPHDSTVQPKSRLPSYKVKLSIQTICSFLAGEVFKPEPVSESLAQRYRQPIGGPMNKNAPLLPPCVHSRPVRQLLPSSSARKRKLGSIQHCKCRTFKM